MTEHTTVDFDTIQIIDGLTALERLNQILRGFDYEHDEEHGIQHLMDITRSYMAGWGEAPTDAFVFGELLKARATITAALELLYRTGNLDD